jgi:hypothetical protein
MKVFADGAISDNDSSSYIVIGATESQFIDYNFNVTALLKGPLEDWAKPTGVNKKCAALNSTHLIIALHFESTLQRAIQLNNSYSLEPFPMAPEYLGGLPGRNFVRTEQSSFGWDWGPALVPVGVDGQIGLRVSLLDVVSQEGIRVASVWPQVLCKNHSMVTQMFYVNMSWILHVTGFGCGAATATTGASCVRHVSVAVASPSLRWVGNTNWTTEVVFYLLDGGLWEGTVSSLLTVLTPALWYPRGYGAQPRHKVRGVVTLLQENERLTIGAATAEWSLPPLAIRCIALKTTGNPQAHVLQPPTAFAPQNISHPSFIADHVMYFSVNDKPIFVKGANVIPPTALPTSDDDERRLRADLESALEAHMNMIRIWGGGYYASDWVYEFCDRYGLLVWQEFMFACSEYPVNENFLSLVRTEVAQQATRLSKYSSIVMWSANNENNVYNTGPSAGPFRTLYSHSILDVLIQFDSSRPLWPSSPAQGFLSGVDNNGLPNRDPFVLDERITTPPRGDTHYYNYFSCPDIGAYPRTHFASEFGFQSFPWQENIEPVSEMVDWSIFSKFMEHRQHHPNGNSEIAELLLRNFFNNSKNLSVITSLPFSRLIYLSQLQQTLCVVDQISFYRRGRDYPEYRSMGALFWQLNQNWQAPSWTSIEYGGEWKVLHYGVRHAFETVHISSFVESGNLFLHITNDHDFTLLNVAAQIFSVRYSDGKARVLSTTRTNITHRSGEFVWSERLNPRLDSFLWAVVAFANVTKTHYLTTTTFSKNISTNCSRFFDISVKSIAFNKATLNVNLVAKHVVTFIFIRSVRHCRGKFSNNLFHLIPCSAQPCVEASASIQLEFANPQNENIGDKNAFLASLAIECK